MFPSFQPRQHVGDGGGGGGTAAIGPRRQRLDSMDIMRTIAIILMVHIHFVDTLSGDLYWSTIPNKIISTVRVFAAPIFTFLVGMSLQLAVHNQEKVGMKSAEMNVRNWWRGMYLLFVDFIINITVWHTRFVFDCDVLSFIGLSTLIVHSMRGLSSITIILIVLAIVHVSPPLRLASSYTTHWDFKEEAYTCDYTIKDIMLGFWINGYFPLFPWLVFPISGLATAKIFLVGGARGWTLPVVGITLVLLSTTRMISNTPAQEFPAECFAVPEDPCMYFYPATNTFVVRALGFVILLFWALHNWFDVNDGNKKKSMRVKEEDCFLLVFCRRYSRFSLTAYVVHQLVLHWPLFLAARLSSKADGPWYYFQDACGTPLALFLASVFIVVFYAVIVTWDRHHHCRYSLEWWERELLGIISRSPSPSFKRSIQQSINKLS